MVIESKPSLKLITKAQKDYIKNLDIPEGLSLKEIAALFGLKLIYKRKKTSYGGMYNQNKKLIYIAATSSLHKRHHKTVFAHELAHHIQCLFDEDIFTYERNKSLSENLIIEQQAEAICQCLLFKKLFPKETCSYLVYFNKTDFNFLLRTSKKYIEENDFDEILENYEKSKEINKKKKIVQLLKKQLKSFRKKEGQRT